jgi:hypothetical protein
VWLRTLFPHYLSSPTGDPIPFAPHHADIWEWVWAIRRGVVPPALVEILARGGGKSTNAEMACVAVGARRVRRYGWYICATQDQADDHVGNVAAMLESRAVGEYYPDLADRDVNKYGTSKGWRRNRLRTRDGFTIDALGLDVAARGAKLDEVRPDFRVFDDIDSETDSVPVIEKKIKIITRKLLPAGAPDAATLVIQNLAHPDGVVTQLADGRADFLAGRIVSGPHPAVRGLTYEQRDGRYVITGGTPTWLGQDLARCQQQLDEWGLSAFLTEAQHEIEAPPGGMFDHLVFRHCDEADLPPLVVTVVVCDPAVTDTDRSDANGVHVDSLGVDGKVYRRWSDERRSTPLVTLKRAIIAAVQYQAYGVLVETDQGGDTWQSVYELAWIELLAEGRVRAQDRKPNFFSEKAGEGHGSKVHRASQMLGAYERGRFVHVTGTHTVLEKALRRFPLTKPYDLVDAAYWGWHFLGKFQPPRTAQNQYAEARW